MPVDNIKTPRLSDSESEIDICRQNYKCWQTRLYSTKELRKSTRSYKCLFLKKVEAVSNEAVSGEAVSDEAVSGEAVSGEAVSDEAVSDEAVSDEAVSGEAVSGEVVSGDLECLLI